MPDYPETGHCEIAETDFETFAEINAWVWICGSPVRDVNWCTNAAVTPCASTHTIVPSPRSNGDRPDPSGSR